MQDVLKQVRSVRVSESIPLIGPYNPSLLEALVPSATTLTKLVVSLAFVGMLVGFSKARFYLPDNPIPITMQTFGVLLTGGVLGARWGLFTVVAWYFMGMAGLQVFAGTANGWAFLSGGATAGYIVGFVPAALLVGYLSQHGWNRGRGLWPMLLGGLVLYLPGLLWLGSFGVVDWSRVLSLGMYPFIPGDLVKLMGASLVTAGLWSLADRRSKSG